jgi:bis(5'-nucleosidyl)-tetraphosphatase
MNEVKSCGVIVFRREPALEFLLMKHATRWDLPKGHVDAGESDTECALRELAEETGISADDIELDGQFCFKNLYYVRDRRFPNELSSKTLLIFLGWLRRDVPIAITEHIGFEWFRWNPPHHIQSFTIDPLLSELEAHFGKPN